MRRRRHRQSAIPAQNLDSFLDILTNTVGVLMFIGLFVALISSEAGYIIRTPLVAQTRKVPYFFEVRDGKVTYVDTREVDRQVQGWLNSLPACPRPSYSDTSDPYLSEYYRAEIQQYNDCIDRKVERLQGFEAETAHYTVRLENLNSLLYQPKSNEGESAEELLLTDSDFRSTLEELDPKSEYLAFIVRPDSFDTFRKARTQARKQGYDVGWEPYEEETPIAFTAFGSGGRSIGVQ